VQLLNPLVRVSVVNVDIGPFNNKEVLAAVTVLEQIDVFVINLAGFQ
jgi:hypothetical protein